MTDIQTRKQNMASSTKEVLDTNLTLWETTPAIVTQHGLLGNSIVRIDTLNIVQGTDISGYASQKKIFKNTMANKTMVVAGPLTTYARVNDNQPLLNKVDISRTTIVRAKSEDAPDIAELVHDEAAALDPAVLGEVGITAGMITDLNNSIVAFRTASPLPRAATSNREAVTIALVEEFTVLDEIMDNMDGLIEPFKATEKDFYNAYHAARRIGEVGVRRISLVVKCTDSVSGAVVTGAEVSIAETGVGLTTTRTGNARFFSLPPGDVTVTINHEFYEPVTLEHVGIYDGKTTRFDLEMVKI